MDRTPSQGRRAGLAPEVPGYEGDVEAWRARDPVRYVGYCVAAEAGAGIGSTSSSDGVGWIVPLRGMTLFVGLDATSERLSVDIPIARVPDRQRVPFLRAALERCDGSTPFRLCVRDDLLIVRRVARVATLPPEGLRKVLREGAKTADRLATSFTAWFDARPPFTDEQRANLTWASAGRARPLKSFSVAPPPRALPSTPSQRAPFPPAPPRPQISPAEPAWTPAPKPPESVARPVFREDEGIPDILSPMFASSASVPPSSPSPQAASSKTIHGTGAIPGAGPVSVAVAPAGRDGMVAPSPRGAPTPPPPSAPAAAALAERRNAHTAPLRRSSQHMDAVPPPSVPTPPVSVRPPLLPEIDGADLGRQSARADQGKTSVDRLCQLLRDAQVLAGALSSQERPGVMVVLIRATVFRAILDHGDALSNAVTHLYRATATATRDLAQLEASGRRGNPAATAEPAFLVMERIIAARGQVSDEKPLHIDPLTSAAHAREHLARYLREIERAPADPALRHFLALGALSELLVRAKLPAKTDQRLREIVAYANRDGPKPAAIDLMMTALSRIVAQ